jgi:hypothetical protein
MALDSEENKQNEATKIGQFLRTHGLLACNCYRRWKNAMGRFRVKGGPGGCRWGAHYGDIDWTVLIRRLEQVSSSGVLWSRVRGRGGSPADQAP